MIHRNIIQLLKERYYLLIPIQADGLVIFSLHEKIKANEIENNFPESIIKETLLHVLNELNESSSRNEYLRDEETIQRLLKHFIEKPNRFERLYKLTGYAIDFCKSIEREMLPLLSPSEIEKTMYDLVDLLRKKANDMGDFQQWYNAHFATHQTQISLQIKALENEVNETMQEFNELAKEYNFIELVKRCDEKLDTIKDQNKKLSHALQSKEDIREILNSSKLHEFASFREIREDIRKYFKEIQYKLDFIDSRINLIKPQINKIFYDLEKRDFDQKLEKFLHYLLDHTTSSKRRIKALKGGTVNEIIISLPQGVEEKEIIDDVPEYINVEYIELSRPEADKQEKVLYDKENLQKQVEKRNRQITVTKRIEFYRNLIKHDLHIKKKINYSHYYFDMLAEENGIDVAVKSTALIIKEFSPDKNYEIEIIDEFQSSPKNKNNQLWKMKITKIS